MVSSHLYHYIHYQSLHNGELMFFHPPSSIIYVWGSRFSRFICITLRLQASFIRECAILVSCRCVRVTVSAK